MSTQNTPVNNSPLSEKELDHFKSRLLDMKKEAEEKISVLKNEIEDLEGNLNDTDSSSAHHQGDLGSNEEIRETKYTLIENQHDMLEKITTALDRFESGNYGICIVTGKPIRKERLEAIPYTLHSIDAKKGQIEPEGEKEIKVSEAL